MSVIFICNIHLRHLNYLHCMLLSAFWKKTGLEVAHPGVDKTHDPLERRYHKYYQWVSFCLFFQVISCVAPHYTARPCPVSIYAQHLAPVSVEMSILRLSSSSVPFIAKL